ncbi:MAG TPA: nucleotide exchange factor GrpE [Streptosporangiaceae bacterium]
MSSTQSSASHNGAVPDALTDALTHALTEALTDGLTERLAGLQASVDRLAAATDREHERAAHREGVIDRLHDDNQRLRRGELQVMLEPLRAALYRLHDMVRRLAAEPPADPSHVGSLFSAIADEVAEALARAGAERYTVESGEPFDQARHRPVGTTPVTDPALDGAVVAAHTDGFAQGEQVLRRAEVVIGQARGSSQAARQNASAESI